MPSEIGSPFRMEKRNSETLQPEERYPASGCRAERWDFQDSFYIFYDIALSCARLDTTILGVFLHGEESEEDEVIIDII